MILILLMNKSRFTINNTGVVVMLLLIGGIGATSTVFSTAHAQTTVTQITSAAQAGKLSISIAGVVFNCPIVNVHV